MQQDLDCQELLRGKDQSESASDTLSIQMVGRVFGTAMLCFGRKRHCKALRAIVQEPLKESLGASGRRHFSWATRERIECVLGMVHGRPAACQSKKPTVETLWRNMEQRGAYECKAETSGCSLQRVG